MSSGKPLVAGHDRAVVLLNLLVAQSQVSHKGHIEVALNHPGVKVSEMGAQAWEDTMAEHCGRGWLVAARRQNAATFWRALRHCTWYGRVPPRPTHSGRSQGRGGTRRYHPWRLVQGQGNPASKSRDGAEIGVIGREAGVVCEGRIISGVHAASAKRHECGRPCPILGQEREASMVPGYVQGGSRVGRVWCRGQRGAKRCL